MEVKNALFVEQTTPKEPRESLRLRNPAPYAGGPLPVAFHEFE